MSERRRLIDGSQALPGHHSFYGWWLRCKQAVYRGHCTRKKLRARAMAAARVQASAPASHFGSMDSAASSSVVRPYEQPNVRLSTALDVLKHFVLK
eukprot:638949-Pleurochrysis_carterae.AAC.2